MLDENVLWQAVARREHGWDGVFVYAVTSTGIYCRPTCPSRRPARDRVRFFAQPTAAAAAGFRPCRRCHPEEGARSVALDGVVRACKAIAGRGGAGLPLSSLARIVGTAPHQLVRSFKRSLGVTPRAYADACRTGCLKKALRNGGGVADAVYASGFGSSSRVYERSGSMLGMTPARYAAAGSGEQVTYASGRSSLGWVLVARTARGICSVTIGAAPERLLAELRREFLGARLEADDEGLAQSVQRIIASIEGRAPDSRLPLDVRATAFQARVWRELQRIPRGTTRTYAQVAEQIGRPAAARAVARACASNPVAVIIPCHRVVRGDGRPGGYRWGARRKHRMLAIESGTVRRA